jgi:hypothetical protein
LPLLPWRRDHSTAIRAVAVVARHGSSRGRQPSNGGAARIGSSAIAERQGPASRASQQPGNLPQIKKDLLRPLFQQQAAAKYNSSSHKH